MWKKNIAAGVATVVLLGGGVSALAACSGSESPQQRHQDMVAWVAKLGASANSQGITGDGSCADNSKIAYVFTTAGTPPEAGAQWDKVAQDFQKFYNDMCTPGYHGDVVADGTTFLNDYNAFLAQLQKEDPALAKQITSSFNPSA